MTNGKNLEGNCYSVLPIAKVHEYTKHARQHGHLECLANLHPHALTLHNTIHKDYLYHTS